MNSVSTEYRSEYFRARVAEGRAVGRAQAKAEDIVTVLESRGLILSADDRARITGCTDLGQLDAWLRRVGSVATAGELFD